MNRVGFEILARTPVPKLPPSYPATTPHTPESQMVVTLPFFYVFVLSSTKYRFSKSFSLIQSLSGA